MRYADKAGVCFKSGKVLSSVRLGTGYFRRFPRYVVLGLGMTPSEEGAVSGGLP